jgi:hypothetical protein
VGDPLFLKKKQKKADDTPSAFCRFWRPKFAGKSGFFQFKKYFLFKTPRKHLNYLDKPIHGHTKNPKLKLFSWTDLSPWARRREKNLGQTPLMKWNLLTLKLTIFMARIVINDDFLSLL